MTIEEVRARIAKWPHDGVRASRAADVRYWVRHIDSALAKVETLDNVALLVDTINETMSGKGEEVGDLARFALSLLEKVELPAGE